MSNVPFFMPGDPVSYVGEKYKERLHGKKGWIHWYVNGNPNAFVVEFPDTRNPKDPDDVDDYIMPARVLAPWRPSEKDKGPEIQPRRRHRYEDE
jgi:hypothetical protein